MNADRLLAHYERIADSPDAIVRLRRFILDLAVRGKIMPQNPADEPASELLSRVATKKAQLLKAGVIRKPKKLAPIDAAEIPLESMSGWLWTRLGDVSTLITKGSTPTSYGHEYTTEGINFIKVESIKNGKLLPANITSFISSETNAFLSRSQLAVGDILFSIAGSIGTCAVVTETILPANTNQALAIIRGTETAFSSDFLMISLQSSVAAAIREKARGGGMTNISLEDIQNFVLPLPPLAEQHRIVAKVGELMALCDRLEAARVVREATREKLAAASFARLNAPDPDTFRDDACFALEALPALTVRADHIKQLRQTILNLAVRGKLVPHDPNDEPASGLLKRIAAEKAHRIKQGTLRKSKPLPPIRDEETEFDLGAGWQWVRMGDVIKLWNGFAFKSGDFQSAGIPVIRIGDLQGGEVTLSDAVYVSDAVARTVSSEVWIPPDALLIAMSGATTGKQRSIALDRHFSSTNGLAA